MGDSYEYATPSLTRLSWSFGGNDRGGVAYSYTHGYRRANMLRLWTGFQSRIVREEKGADLVEYVLLVSLIAVIAMAAVVLFGRGVTDNFDRISDTLP
jgi:Flp pilus assembly pilin Flp